MAKKASIKINYRDLEQYRDFMTSWADNLKGVDDSSVLDEQPVLEAIAEFVRKEIQDSLVQAGDTSKAHGFGAFMAKRTRVVVEPKNKEVHIRLEGLKESELPEEERRASKNNPDVNLWDLYERGLVGQNIGDSGATKAVVKDVGAVLAIRQGSKFQEMKGSRAGLMAQIFGQIRAELIARLPDLISADTRQKVFAAAEEAVRESQKARSRNPLPAKRRGVANITRLGNWARHELAKAVKDEQETLARMGVNIEVTARKQVVARGAGGRFVSSPITKVVLQNKTN